MNDAKSTLEGCLEGLPLLMQTRIRNSRREATRQLAGSHGRPQILHTVRNSQEEQHFEVWEQEPRRLGTGGNGCIVVLQTRVFPPASAGCLPERRAVKIIPVDDKRWKYYLRELDALIRFSNDMFRDFFVRFLGWYKFDYEDHLFIITEYCENGDLRSYLRAQPGCRLPEREVKDIARQVLATLRLMHWDERIHGDIKLNNVLVIQRPPNRWKVKICDLGLSKRVEQAVGSNGSTSIHFSPGYCPPEKTSIYYNNEQIDGYKADMWCFGELVLQALTGQPSFKNPKDFYTWCQTGEGFPDRLLREIQVSEGAISFLHSVMVFDPAARPSAETAQRHRWFVEPDTRPAAGKLAPSLSRFGRKSRRSTSYVRVQSEVSDVGYQAWRRRHRSGVEFALAAPFPPHTVHGHVATPLKYRNDPYETEACKHPYPLSIPQLRVGLDVPLRQQHLDLDYPAKPDFGLHWTSHARGLSDNSWSLKASLNRADAPRQGYNNPTSWAQNTCRSYYGPHKPVESLPREEIARLRDLDALLKEAVAQHIQKQEELAQLHELVALYRDKKETDFLRYGLVRLSERHREAERLGELLARLRDNMTENAGSGEAPVDAQLREASVQLREAVALYRDKDGGGCSAPRSDPSSMTL